MASRPCLALLLRLLPPWGRLKQFRIPVNVDASIFGCHHERGSGRLGVRLRFQCSQTSLYGPPPCIALLLLRPSLRLDLGHAFNCVAANKVRIRIASPKSVPRE